MNILVTGANGQLGNELRILAGGSSDRFIFTDVTAPDGVDTVYLDITNIDAVRLIAESERVDLIVNCAAYTNVDKAEDDPETADLLNHIAPRNLACVASERGAALIHISTDYVFSGVGCTPLRESDVPDPKSVYGSTKLAGETAVREAMGNAIIIRTAWLYSPFGKNFARTMKNLTAVNDTVKVVFDQVGTPTCASDLAALIMHIISTGQLSKSGIYHFSDEGAVSWYDFACAVSEICGHSCRVLPCLSSEYPSKVSRPKYSVLDKSLVKSTFGFDVPYWRTSLEGCLKRMK